MTVYARGINPIWLFDNLTGQIMDDTYYFWVLQNTLPYLPANVYKSSSGTVWSNPIRLLANGTLPNNIYFDPSLTYRLEWRKNDGVNPPSQNDALIYLVENYIPDGTSSVNPVTQYSQSDNQIENPQFFTVNSTLPLTINTATTTNIAPGWDVITSGAGTLVVTQVAQSGNVWTATNATNAPYYLSLNNNGFDTVTLRQRFNGNGALWTGEAAALNFTAWASNDVVLLDAITYSNVTGVNFDPASLTTVPTDYRRSLPIPSSTSSDLPNVAWTEVDFSFQANTTVNITSVQVVGQDSAVDINYIQTTPEAQVSASNGSPVGTIIDYAGTTVPGGYLLCDGSSQEREKYPLLFAAIGTTWGSVDGTHFTLPALQGYTTAGAGAGAPLAPLNAAIGSYVGDATHAILMAEMPAHNHTGSTVQVGNGSGGGIHPRAQDTGFTNQAIVDIATAGGGILNTSGSPMTIVQPTAIVNKLIKYQ